MRRRARLLALVAVWAWLRALAACGAPGGGEPADAALDIAADVPDVAREASCDADLQADPGNCGACMRACGAGEACVEGVCRPTCRTGETRCGAVCANTRTDAQHCGACGTTCRAGHGCVDGACVPVCPGDQVACGALCVSLDADPRHCGVCDRACGPGEACVEGACETSCPRGQMACSGMCVNVLSDPRHCGLCGRACAAGQTCVSGTCATSCPTGQTDCAGECVNLQDDPRHCGACARACAAGQACASGLCATSCPAGQIVCGGICIDPDTDGRHCGGCGNLCAVGQACSEGTCVTTCPIGQTACGGSCANLQTDPRHCGRCGAACAAGQACVASRCEVSCPTGQAACGTACANLQTDAAHCGMCGRACPAGQRCSVGVCVTSCPTGETACGTACVNLQNDAANCGACGARCVAGQSCAAGRCACPAGQTVCGTACVNTQSDTAHCGMCGRACPSRPNSVTVCASGTCLYACSPGFADCDGVATTGCETSLRSNASCGACGAACRAGERCVAGACQAVAPGGAPFRIGTLASAGCAWLDHEAVTGDDRGGIAVSTSHVFYSGDGATGRFGLSDLAGGAVAARPPYDALVSDVRNGAVYALGVAPPAGSMTPTPLTRAMMSASVDRLLELNPATGALTGSAVMLSTPIPVNATVNGGTGIFSGYGRIAVYNGANVFQVLLPSGTVTDLGTMAFPRERVGCDSLGFWGMVEVDAGVVSLAYVRNSTTISRVTVPNAAVSTVATFTNLGNLCGFVVSPATQRWYFHHAGASQFGGMPTGETLGYCPATWEQPGGTFRLTSLGSTSCTRVDHATLTGDDRGGIAVSRARAYYSGDVATGRFNLADLSAAGSAAPPRDALVANLRTGAVYSFAVATMTAPTLVARGAGTVMANRLVPLDNDAMPAGAPITLSAAIPLDTSGVSAVGIFSGWDRAVVLAAGNAYVIALPSGTVTNLGPSSPPPSRAACDSWAYWGVAEYDGTANYVVYAQNSMTVSRLRVPAPMTPMVTRVGAAFTNLGDTCSLTFLPFFDRWYFHYEGVGQFGGAASSESLVHCPATFDQP